MRKTIFEYAPESHGALDYMGLVDHVRRLRGDARLLDRDGAATPTAPASIAAAG